MFPISFRSIRSHQQGLSLIELMIGMTLGLLIVAGLGVVFANSSRARSETEKNSQQIENGRYAAQLLMEDLAMAGYYGELNPVVIATPAAKPDACDFLPASLAAAIALPIQGYDGGAGSPTCVSDVVAGSDILVVRRTSTCVAGSAGCDAIDTTKSTYFQTGLCSSDVGQYVIDTDATKFILTKSPTCGTVATPGPNKANLRAYYTHIYFVANNNKTGDGIPTLKMVELGSGVFSAPIALVAGIEQMQLEYGIANIPSTSPPAPVLDSKGAPVVYTDPDSYVNPCGAGCLPNWRSVTSVKLHLLARNTLSSLGYSDAKTYVLGQKSDGSDNSFGPYNDAFKRHAYTTVIRLNNVAGRLE